ncbi:hypothetical protein QBC47DRAFT_385740 [Echria macrotheca]|uniref:Uncharacterized protein n=1 Tax=Echria macrotheca TaxID=438768 RepID=A0AAJ0B9E2_9PEZI|nr:hypothetical protein QBC47DRAFT_385740 [Echria macrotheca]
MGVTEIPLERWRELEAELKKKPPVERAIELVKEELGQDGKAVYHEARQKKEAVKIYGNSVVFLILGGFECEGKMWNQGGHRYDISDSEQITLQPKTAVVIIDHH